MALSDLIDNFKSVFRRKNVDSAFEALSDVLDEISTGGNGGGSDSVVNVELATGSSGFFETPNPIPSYILITTTGPSSDGNVGVWLPAGTSHGIRTTIKWVADNTDEGTDLSIEVMGYSLADASNTYVLPKTRMSLGGFIEIEWDSNYGRWFIISKYNVECADPIVGKTSYYFYFEPTDASTTHYITPSSSYDVMAEIGIDMTENTDTFVFEIGDGGYAGQRLTLQSSLGSNIFSILGTFTDNSSDVGTLTLLGGEVALLLEWKASVGRWFVIDKLTGPQ